MARIGVTSVAALASVLVCTTAVHAQTWTEARVIELARRHAPTVRVARAEAALARASVVGVGQWPNPALQWNRQHVVEGARYEQDIVQLDVPVVLSGRLRAESELARAAAFGASADAEWAALDALANVLEHFYTTLAWQERARERAAAAAELDEGLRVLARREESGVVSGFERARLALEVELARSERAIDEAEADAARRELAAMVGATDAPNALAGTLDTADPPSLAAVVRRGLGEHPALRDAGRAQAAAAAAERDADLAWIPDLVLSAGLDLEQDPMLRAGYVLGARIEIPIAGHGQGLRAEAAARRALGAARRDALESQIRARVEAAHARWGAAHAELARFGQATRSDAELVIRAARSAYAEGRAPLAELLDAQRAVRAVALRRIELALRAKRAEVLVRATTGTL